MKAYTFKILLVLFILVPKAQAFHNLAVTGDNAFEDFVNRANTVLTTSVDQEMLRQIASRFDPSTKFLEVLPERPNLTYIDLEKAKFTLLIKTRPTNPDFRIVPTGTFPDDTQEIRINKVGNSYHMETPPLVAGDPVFTARAVLENGAQVDAYKKTISESETKITEYQAILTHTTDPTLRAFYEQRIATLTNLIQSLNHKIASSRLTLQEIATTLHVAFNHPPVAVITAQPQAGFAPLTVNFSAAGSSDPDSQIVGGSWDFDDGSTGTGMNVSHLFLVAKTYHVKLTVTDDRGKTGIVFFDLIVQSDGQAPTMAISPEDGAEIITTLPTITVSYHDAETGLNLSSFNLKVDGEDVTSRAAIDADHATLQFTTSFPLVNGIHNIEGRIRDLAGNLKVATSQLTVDTGEIAEGFITGTVTEPNDAPIEGVNVGVSVGPIGYKKLNVTTDAEGRFRLPFSTTGDFVLQMGKTGFTQALRSVEIVAQGRDFDIGQVAITPADIQVTQIDAGVGGTASNLDGSASVTIPAGASSGTLDVSITNYQNVDGLPTRLPELSMFTYAFAPEPYGAEFSVPVEFRIENILGFAHGTELVVGVVDPALGRWVDSGLNAVVVPDKKMQGAISWSPKAFSVADTNQPTVCRPKGGPVDAICKPPIVETTECVGCDTPPPPPPPPGCPEGTCCPEGDGKCGTSYASRINLETGSLATDHDLPSVKRFGNDYSLRLSYNSTSAVPTGFVSAQTNNFAPEPADGVEAKITFSAATITGSFEGTAIVSPSLQRALFSAKNAEGKFLESGSYSYEIETATRYDESEYATATYFGAPAGTRLGVLARVPVKLRMKGRGRTIIQNERKSPIGVGWTLSGIERLIIDPEGTVLWSDGRGNAQVFTPLGPHPQGGLDVGLKSVNFSKKLTSSPEIVSLSYRSGFIYGADCKNNRIYRIDLSGHLEVIAGTGERGFAGDGNQAINAKLNCPLSVYGAERGGFYIADSGNYRIRKVSPAGIITTIAGNGSIAESAELTEATSAGIGRPTSVAEDKLFSVFFTTTSDKVKFINPRGKLETYSGKETGYVEAIFKRPSQVFFDFYDNPIVVDKLNDRIVQLYPQAKLTRDLLNGSKKSKSEGAQIGRPQSVAFDPILKRYFILEETGRVLLWKGPDHRGPLVEIDTSGNTLKKLDEQNKAFSAKIKAMTYSPEVGLILFDGSSLKMATLVMDKSRQKSIQAEEEEYLSPKGEFSKLVRLSDGSFERRLIGGDKILYNEKGLMTALIKTNQQNQLYFYDDGNRLVRFSIATNDFFILRYDGRGYLSEIEDPAGRVTSFEIDENGHLTKITNPDGTEKSFEYSSDGLLTSETKESGEETLFGYRQGRIVSETHSGGRERSILPAMLVGIIDLDNKDVKGNSPIVKPDDLKAEVESIGGSCNSKLLVDNSGFLKERENCLGGKVKLDRNLSGLITKRATAENRIYENAYDAKGRVSEMKDQNGTTALEYEPVFGKKSKITDSDGNHKDLSYNPLGLVQGVVDEDGNQTAFGYGSLGILSSATDALNNSTSFEVDASKNMNAIVDAQGNRTEFERDAAGNIVKITDAQGRESHFEFDLMGRVLKSTDALQGVTRFTYTSDGKIATVTDANNNTTAFEYNPNKLLSKITNPQNQQEQFFYDSENRLTRKVQKDNSEILFAYDLMGHLTLKTTTDNQVAMEYDGDGLLTHVTDNDSENVLVYDNFQRLVSSKQTNLSFPIRYSYNNRGLRDHLRYLTDVDIEYFYDKQGLLDEIQANIFGRNLSWSRTRDALKRPVEDTLPNGIRTNYNFDSLSRLQNLEHILPDAKMLSGFEYAFSPIGNIISKTETIGGYTSEPGVLNFGFQYDSLYRLINTSNEGNFNLDLLGNRTGLGYSTNSLNQTMEDPKFIYTWDTNGRLSTRTDKRTGDIYEYTWSVESELVSVYIKEQNQNPKLLITNKYDGQGKRIEKQVTDFIHGQNSYTRRFIYDNEDIFFELDGQNHIIAVYLHGPGIDDPIAMLRDVNGNGRFEENEVFIYTKDHLGSIKDITDFNAELKQRYSYSVYGVTKLEKDDTNSSNQFVENPYVYTSREWEQETGCYYYRARWYCPEMEKFISEDPLGFGGGDKNLYAYVSSSPINKNDPSGRGPVLAAACLRAAQVAYQADQGDLTATRNRGIDELNRQIALLQNKSKNQCSATDNTQSQIASLNASIVQINRAFLLASTANLAMLATERVACALLISAPGP
ncbi:MAG: carboxypeptidase regulatory-like domain-containing protein [Bdellovibrio sp.]|nr:carboxypeptidase regulatory-like domain-containing protein [Bdellovibrio sp.]